MKLLPGVRVALGDRALAFPHPPTVCLRADGSALAAIEEASDDGANVLVHVDETGVQGRMPLPEGEFGAQPVIVDRGDLGVLVLVDHRIALAIDAGFGTARTVEIEGAPEDDAGEPRLTAGGIARPTPDGDWLTILTDPVSFQNARTIGRLRIDGHAAAWVRTEMLDGADYPMSGARTASGTATAPILGDALDVGAERFVSAEGSDRMSMLKYGADFFTLAVVDAERRVTRRLYEESGWKRMPGKHGIRARFTTDGASAILSPVFGTGDWKGRQRMLTLADGMLEEVPRVRGTAGFALVDVRGDHALLASPDEVLFATLDR